MNNVDDFISIEAAAASTGLTSRTIRYWISNGKLSCTSGKRGRLVKLRDIEQIKEITGRASGSSEYRHPENTSAGKAAGNHAGSVSTSSIVGADGLSLDLMHIRDQLLAPLLEQYAILDREKTVLATEVGELRSDLRHERERREEIMHEREALLRRVEELQQQIQKAPDPIVRSEAPLVATANNAQDEPVPQKRPSFFHRILHGNFDRTGLPASR